jgi:hypothetical protein
VKSKKVIKNFDVLTREQQRVVNHLTKTGWVLITLNGYIRLLEDNAVELQDDQRRSITVQADGSHRLPS